MIWTLLFTCLGLAAGLLAGFGIVLWKKCPKRSVVAGKGYKYTSTPLHKLKIGDKVVLHIPNHSLCGSYTRVIDPRYLNMAEVADQQKFFDSSDYIHYGYSWVGIPTNCKIGLFFKNKADQCMIVILKPHEKYYVISDI